MFALGFLFLGTPLRYSGGPGEIFLGPPLRFIMAGDVASCFFLGPSFLGPSLRSHGGRRRINVVLCCACSYAASEVPRGKWWQIHTKGYVPMMVQRILG